MIVVFSLSALMEKDKRLMEASRWQRLTEGATGSCSDRQGMLGKSLIQFSVDGWGCVSSTLYLGPNYGEGNESDGDLLPKMP